MTTSVLVTSGGNDVVIKLTLNNTCITVLISFVTDERVMGSLSEHVPLTSNTVEYYIERQRREAFCMAVA